MEEKIYNLAEVAEYFKVRVQTVKNWITRKQIKAFRTPGGMPMITEAEIKRIVNGDEINAVLKEGK